jgi:CRP/FNR family cyclic AMP-dependent transcriptional regulator
VSARAKPRADAQLPGEPGQSSHEVGQAAVRLLDADPALGARLSDVRCAEAERVLLVTAHGLNLGRCDLARTAHRGGAHLGLLVLEGVIVCELTLADHASAELLGPGDLIRPWRLADSDRLLGVDIQWSVHSPATVAVLNQRLAAELTAWPEIIARLLDRLSERSQRLATTRAISELKCVDRRLSALFWHLAERWGRVTSDGVVIPLALTHRLLAQLVGARRPTVTAALSDLAQRAELCRRPDGSWLLRGDPPQPSIRTPSPSRPRDLLRPARAHRTRPDTAHRLLA